jgi:hypothetical protein
MKTLIIITLLVGSAFTSVSSFANDSKKCVNETLSAQLAVQAVSEYRDQIKSQILIATDAGDHTAVESLTSKDAKFYNALYMIAKEACGAGKP